MLTTGNPLSLYIHLPFCHHKCPYCHFFVLPNQEKLKDELLEGLFREWELIAPLITPYRLTSLYFGGGTPTLFGAERLARLLELWSFDPGIEITLEANPEDVTPELIRSYRDVGINRLSLGIQSLDPQLLQKIGRNHSPEKAEEAVYIAHQEGIDNITVDLIYDLPTQTLDQFIHTVKRASLLPITHLSLYNLTFEPGSLYYKEQTSLSKLMPNSDESLKMIQFAASYLEQAGLHRYEISAFARPGFEAVHNSGYWTGHPFWGLGPSAFSYFKGRRFKNISHLKRYCLALEKGQFPHDFEEKLSYPANLHELLAINLRLLKGVDLNAFESRHGPLPLETHQTLQKLTDEGFLTKKPRLALTEKGCLFYDSVATEII